MLRGREDLTLDFVLSTSFHFDRYLVKAFSSVLPGDYPEEKILDL